MGFKVKETETVMLYPHFQSLKTQYVVDIMRLTFIVEGKLHMHDIIQNATCHFCNGTIKPQNRISYIDASKSELSHIIAQLQGLPESEDDITAELEEVRRKIKTVENRRT